MSVWIRLKRKREKEQRVGVGEGDGERKSENESERTKARERKRERESVYVSERGLRDLSVIQIHKSKYMVIIVQIYSPHCPNI